MCAIIARYLKVFKSADPAWFYLHASCQFSAYVVGVAGWGTGVKLGSESPGIQCNAHRTIGIILLCLGTSQELKLDLPKPNQKLRFYWNIYHHLVGYGVIILGVIIALACNAVMRLLHEETAKRSGKYDGGEGEESTQTDAAGKFGPTMVKEGKGKGVGFFKWLKFIFSVAKVTCENMDIFMFKK
ncbi:hypothetical protein GQ457_05G031750 [Hibiscus cannabinus]